MRILVWVDPIHQGPYIMLQVSFDHYLVEDSLKQNQDYVLGTSKIHLLHQGDDGVKMEASLQIFHHRAGLDSKPSDIFHSEI